MSDSFEPVIGLEVHAQLKTKSKIFSSSANQYDPEHPNRFINEYCLGLPGVLPVLNREVVSMAIKAGLALRCTIRERSVWSRKQYFYPDLPKGYQISQYDEPLCEHGHLEVQTAKDELRRINIIRIHMEEDAGKSTHLEDAPCSVIDFNRSGVPLIEIVSGPDLRSPQEAGRYLKELRSILMALEICDGNMEEGSFRCDANISLRPRGTETFGRRCEIKNLNSFRFVEHALAFEINRQARLLQEGRAVVQETRLFDSKKGETSPMRSKEEAHDYRYFPDPDLPPLIIERGLIDSIAATIPELPAAKRKRYVELGIPEEHARAFAEEQKIAAFFDRSVERYPKGAVGIANIIKGEVLRELKDHPRPSAVGAEGGTSGARREPGPESGIIETRVRPEDIAELQRLRDADKVSSTQQKKLFQKMWKSGDPIDELLEEEGQQIDDESALLPIIEEVVARSPKEVAKYQSGKGNVLSYFIGQVMKATKGKAKPPLVRDLVIKTIESREE